MSACHDPADELPVPAGAEIASLLFDDFRRGHREEDSQPRGSAAPAAGQPSLASLLSRVAVLHSGSGSASSPVGPGLPDVGTEIFGFRLRAALGAGAFARVFLADQLNLAARPVVLKVSGLDGHEPQTLAQMQHTHIVPIHSVHEDAKAGLRAVCMPYFGGASLAAVLQAVWKQLGAPTRGSQLVAALRQVEAPPPDAPASGDGERTPRARLEGLSYVRAAAWVVARLAEGLQHAHQRGVLHRDIKPSNVLLAADGQPMLLDFNLAQSLATDPAAATLGGTVAYMAPEHLRALAFRSPRSVREVDHRSDLYSLGMVLYEMVTGHGPFEHVASYTPLPALIEAMAVERGRTVPSLRARRPDVPWGLESITRKCLAPDPAQRYQHAEDLAEDLRRFLDDRPLRYAPELSRTERVRKWLRRHPRLTSAGFVATAAGLLLAAVVVALASVRGHLARAREHLAAAQARERKQAYETGAVRAVCLVNTTTDLQDHLPLGLRTCEETLGLYDVLGRDDWQEHPDWRQLEPAARQRLAEETRELLLLLARARVRSAPGDRATLAQALALLDRAEAIRDLAPSPALWYERAAYCELLGDAAQAGAAREAARGFRPVTARDHYLLATTYLRQGGPDRHARALAELDAALRLDPRHYWAWVQRGICRQELGEYALAAGDFGTCVGLWPEFAWGYFNRAAALDQAGKKAEAVADYTAALERDPDFLLARLNRGMAYLERKSYAEALADFDEVLAKGRRDTFLLLGRAQALEGLGRAAEADAAFAAALERDQDLPGPEWVRHRLAYGFAVSKRLPEAARKAFDAVLARSPGNAQALYGLAVLLVERGQEEAALTALGRSLEQDPGFLEARRARAVLLARRGSLDEAGSEINGCLEKDPWSGATLYAAACVAARCAERLQADAARPVTEQALDLLRKAFAQGTGRDRAAADPDLAVLRDHPEFRRLLAGP
jgi:eukaryotic-like serine/threonine-protein kinase